MILLFFIVGIVLGVFAILMFYKNIDGYCNLYSLIFLVWLPGLLSEMLLLSSFILLLIKLSKL